MFTAIHLDAFGHPVIDSTEQVVEKKQLEVVENRVCKDFIEKIVEAEIKSFFRVVSWRVSEYYAEAALEGWHKEEQTAGIIIHGVAGDWSWIYSIND